MNPERSVLTSYSWQVYRLREKDMDTKLDILFRKNMYTLAINLVTSAQNVTSRDAIDVDPASVAVAPAETPAEYDYGTVVEIYKRYGDWLYSKSEYDSAMQQYLQTIGQLEPSYVIRKFLDAQRIHNLTSYLQALHEKGLANADHTTLLLNCYTKLKDVQRLDEFVKTDQELRFDVETAIRVCTQGGFHDHALWLAKRFGENEWYLRIQMEDLKGYSDTVDYLRMLDAREIVRLLGKYGYVLVTEMPAEMTELLIELSTKESEKPIAWPEDFIHLYVNRTEWCVKYLERLLERKWNVYIAGKGKGRVIDAASPDELDVSMDKEEAGRDRNSKTVVCNTLLELYLGAGRKSTVGNEDEVRRHTEFVI